MKSQNVHDPLVSKRQQYLLATQLVRAILKIDGKNKLHKTQNKSNESKKFFTHRCYCCRWRFVNNLVGIVYSHSIFIILFHI